MIMRKALVSTRRQSVLLVLLSLLVVLTLGLSAGRSEWLYWKPPIVLLVVLYWLLFEPQTFGLVFAFTLGLLVDFMTGAPAGESAMAFCVTAYCAQTMEHRLLHFTILHQCLLVAGLVVIYQLISATINLAVYGGSLHLSQFYPAVTALLVWPLIAGVLGRLHRRAL